MRRAFFSAPMALPCTSRSISDANGSVSLFNFFRPGALMQAYLFVRKMIRSYVKKTKRSGLRKSLRQTSLTKLLGLAEVTLPPWLMGSFKRMTPRMGCSDGYSCRKALSLDSRRPFVEEPAPPGQIGMGLAARPEPRIARLQG